MILIVTTALTCVLATLLLVLSFAVVQQRRASGVSLGDKGNVALERKIRAQANLVEYAPLFVLLIAVSEIRTGATPILWLLAALFVIARCLHGVALAYSHHNPAFRALGMVLTCLALAGGIILNLVQMALGA